MLLLLKSLPCSLPALPPTRPRGILPTGTDAPTPTDGLCYTSAVLPGSVAGAGVPAEATAMPACCLRQTYCLCCGGFIRLYRRPSVPGLRSPCAWNRGRRSGGGGATTGCSCRDSPRVHPAALLLPGVHVAGDASSQHYRSLSIRDGGRRQKNATPREAFYLPSDGLPLPAATLGWRPHCQDGPCRHCVDCPTKT